MAVTQYTKTLATQPNLQQLKDEIDADATITPKYVADEGIDWTSPNVLHIWMSDALTAGEETALDAVIAAHTPITPLEDTNSAVYKEAREPAATDDITKGVAVDDWWYDTVSDGIYICTDNTEGAAVWALVSDSQTAERSKSIFQIVFTTQSDPYKTTSASDWEILSRFRFTGTDVVGDIVSIKVVAQVVSGNGTGSAQIRDITNNTVIAEASNIINTADPAIFDLGTISNVPTDEAVFEVRGMRSSGAASTIGYSAIHLEF